MLIDRAPVFPPRIARQSCYRFLPPQPVAAKTRTVLYKEGKFTKATANDPDFVFRDDVIEDAYWLIFDRSGRPQLCDVHLTEDKWSPNGFCFDWYSYVLADDGTWNEIDGGRYWDYADAPDLLLDFPGELGEVVPLSMEDYKMQQEESPLAACRFHNSPQDKSPAMPKRLGE